MEKKDIDLEIQQFQMSIANTIFEQSLTYLLWKIEKYKTIEELKEALTEIIKKVHTKNMRYIEHIINED